MCLRINDEVKRQERITCSVGVGPNKLIVKIASGYQKPAWLTFVRPEDVRCFLLPSRPQRFTEIVKKQHTSLK